MTKAKRFLIGGDISVSRLGFGAMRITGPGIWGEPSDRTAALATLRRLRGLGVDFVDTADSYGPDVSEQLIKEAIHPYGDTVVATKGGLARTGPNQWVPLARPEYLIQQVHKSLRNLGVERIDLWQLHRIDPRVDRSEQFDAVADMVKRGLIRLAGLSEVSVEEISAASKHFKVATVQNRFNLADQGSIDVLRYCEQSGIGFIPWAPLGSGAIPSLGASLEKVAARHSATPAQVAIAWALQVSDNVIVIPGTSKVNHLEENVQAGSIELSSEDMRELG